jgi:hypothetical protein
VKLSTRRRHRRLASIEAKLAAHHIRGDLLSLKLATALRNDYFRLEAINESMKSNESGLTSEELAAARRTLTRRISEMIKTVPSAGQQYTFADVLKDSARFYKLWRKWRKAQHEGEQLTHGEDVELAFLTGLYLIYEHSPEGIARREAQALDQAAINEEWFGDMFRIGGAYTIH